jgi:hypothetical protein
MAAADQFGAVGDANMTEMNHATSTIAVSLASEQPLQS